MQFLPKHQHIVIPDLPGHGGTDGIELKDDIYSAFVDKLLEVGCSKHFINQNLKYIPANISNWTVFFSFVRFQFIRVVGLETHPVHIIGLSMGGAIATCYSATHPENVMATTIMCPASKFEFAYCPLK